MKSLGKILKGFNKTVAELEQLEAANAAEASSKRTKASTLINEAEAKEDEAKKAASVRLNITKLLGGQ